MKSIIQFIMICCTLILSFAFGTNIFAAENTEKTDTQEQIHKTEESLEITPGENSIFIGKAEVVHLFDNTSWRPYYGAIVKYAPAARTDWHTHPAGQVLIVTDGTIITGTGSGLVQAAKTGDIVLCPPDIRHWHGALENEGGAHIAITGFKDGSLVTWEEKVNAKEYAEAIAKITK